MVGNLANATLALSDHKGANDYLYSRHGSTREVYLIDDVIYKVDLITGENDREYQNGQLWAGKLPQGVYIPEMTLYSVADYSVLAMEYIDGILTGDCESAYFSTPCTCDYPCMSEDLSTKLYSLGWTDSGWSNAIYYDGVYYLIDVAC